MNPRALWASVQRWYATHSTRDEQDVLGVGLAALASLLYLGVVDPVMAYRKHVAEETSENLEELERDARFLNAADSLRAERDQLQKRLDEAKSRLLPGDSGTLGAAALQEKANAIAAAKNITVQSTQVMREEAAEPFRKVSVRLTVSGELKPFADFISNLEYGPQQLNLPFVEISRRGAVAGQKGPRTLSATVEVSGYLRGAGAGEKEKEGKADEAAAAEGENAPAEGEGPPAGEGEGGGPKPAAEGEGAAAKPAGEGEAAAAKPAPEGAPGAPGAVKPDAAPPAPSPAPGSPPPAGPPAAPPAPPAPSAGGRGEPMPSPGAQNAPAPSAPAPPGPAPGAPPPGAPPVAAPPPPPPADAKPPPPPVAAAPVVPVPPKGGN